MDPRFISTPDEAEIGEALRQWPELSGRRVRPLVVSAFGELFLETETGEVWSADPIEIACGPVAPTVGAFQALLADPAWAQERLLTEVVLLARDKGVERLPHQVFAIAPHPCFTGSILAGTLQPMSLRLWHDIVRQIREQTKPSGPPAAASL